MRIKRAVGIICQSIVWMGLFWAQNGRCSEPATSLDQSAAILKHFVETDDTTGIHASIDGISAHFDAGGNTPEMLDLLLKVAQKEAHLERFTLKYLYLTIRRFYEKEDTKIKNFEYSLKIYKILSQSSDYEGLMWILMDIGNIYFSELDYDQATTFYRKAETAALKIRHNYGLSVIYLNFGLIGERQNDYAEALRNYKISSQYRLLTNNVKVVSSTYIKIAFAYLNLKQLDSTLVYIHLAEDFYYHKGSKTNVLDDLPFSINYVYSEYYAAQNQYDKALEYVQKSKRYAEKHDLIHEVIVAQAFESNYYLAQKKYEKAIAVALEMLPLAKKQGVLGHQRFVYKQLRICYSAMGEFKKADEASKKYILIDDSINKSKHSSQLGMIRSVNAVYESQAKLNETRKKLHIATVKNKMRIKERNAFILIAILSVGGIIILAGLFFNSRNNKIKLLLLHKQLLKQNNAIESNSVELKRSNQLKDNLFSIIARDLKDPLNVLLRELENVKKSVPEKHLTDPIENTLKETINLFEGLLKWSKTDEEQNIYSPQKVGLDENINKIILFYLPEIQAREIQIVNKSIALATYADQNILQTLLRNLFGNSITSVSSGGKKGTIEIETRLLSGNRIEIIFSDSGPGFPEEIIRSFNQEVYETGINNKGLGLSICKVLAKMSKWDMTISNGGVWKGARVSIVIPQYMEDMVATGREIQYRIPEKNRIRLLPLKAFKFYQTSQIRLFLKELGDLDDPISNEWLALFEKAVHEGDQKSFERLMIVLEEREV